MQVFSVWQPKAGAFCAVLQFEVGLSFSSCCFSRSRRKSWGLSVVSSDFVNGRNKGYIRSSKFYVSNCKFALFCEPKRSSFGSSFSIALALQKEVSESELRRVGNGLDSELSNIGENGVLGNSIDYEDEVDCKSGEQARGVNGERIDVRALAKSLHSAETADDVEVVLKDKAEFPSELYSSIINRLGWDKKMGSAMALVEWLKRKKKETGGAVGPNQFTYNSLLGAVKHSNQYELTEKIVTDMVEDGFLPTLVTYNHMIIIFVNRGQPAKALKILEEMQSKDFKFNPPSCSWFYSTALLAYQSAKEKYLKGNLSKETNDDWGKRFPDIENLIFGICYQVMRRWLVQRENMTIDVLRLLTDMDWAGLQPSPADYEKLVLACTRGEHFLVAKKLYDRIRVSHSEISLSVCNHLIWVLGKAEKWWEALEIYEDMFDRGPKPDNKSYILIAKQFNIILTEERRRGLSLLNKMVDKGIKPGIRGWDAVLIACSKASETTAAIQIFKRMVELGKKPTTISYAALLGVLEKDKLYDEAVRVWDHMLKLGIKPNLYAYTIMASVFTGLGKFKLVDATLEDMVASGIKPTVVTYNAIISACAHNKMGKAAYEWFERMKVQNITPNEITYEMVIEALAADGKPKMAYALYLKARDDGLNLSAKALTKNGVQIVFGD